MKIKIKIIISLLICFAAIILGIGLGSIYISPADIFSILAYKLFSAPKSANISENYIAIVWNLRLPRTLLAFIVGGALAVSGTVMQSVLRNPLASSYTLGVSSGASVGAAFVIVTGFSIPILGIFTLPFVGLLAGLLTVYVAVKFAARMDTKMENNTIILVGMVFSLFINAILTLIMSISKEHLAQLTFWQLGSFSLKEWTDIAVLFPIVLVGITLIMRYTKEMDILTFGEEQAFSMGIDVSKLKWLLLGLAAALTGSAISFVGVIGFIDLIAPHVVRRIFGSAHSIVIPMSMLFGGAFMVICDLIARTIISPSELPVGAITALVGAPFFAYIYFSKRKVQ
ncbi:MAG: iron ABC transporter permease [Clostridia bacterium]